MTFTPTCRAEGLAVLLVAVAFGGACASPGRTYDLSPVPHAGDGAPPVKAQVRRVAWDHQPEDSDLAPGARVAVEVDVYNADAKRTFSVHAPRLQARSAFGGAAFIFPPVPPGDELALGPYAERDAPVPSEATLPPHEARTVWGTFVVPEGDELRGAVRLVVIVPVEGQPDLEIAIADPVPGGPRWRPDDPLGAVYLTSGVTYLAGPPSITVLEPFGFTARRSFGRWVLGLSERLGYIYQQALAGGPAGFGLSLLPQLTWHPWRWSFAPYVEAGALLGAQSGPLIYGGSSQWLLLPRVGAGFLYSMGTRLGPSGVLPFDRPLSPQRRMGIRFGYAHWFNVGDAAGVGGVQLSFELGGVL